MSENSSVLHDLQSMESVLHGIKGQISQIPGLSQSTPDPEEKARGRRSGVLDSDSDYVKLAKQGGHKGLLWHEQTITPNANSYKPPDWFSTAPADNGKPSLIDIEEKKTPGAFQAPFGTDNMSVWERGNSSHLGREKKHNAIRDQTECLESPQQSVLTSKFRRIVFDKKPAPVDMSKLLSFGYVEDDKPEDK